MPQIKLSVELSDNGRTIKCVGTAIKFEGDWRITWRNGNEIVKRDYVPVRTKTYDVVSHISQVALHWIWYRD
jgi:hypothetical protein